MSTILHCFCLEHRIARSEPVLCLLCSLASAGCGSIEQLPEGEGEIDQGQEE